MNLQSLSILRGSSEKDITGSSGVLIIPSAKSFSPENGSISSFSFNEKAIELIEKSLLERSVFRSAADSIDGFLEEFSYVSFL